MYVCMYILLFSLIFLYVCMFDDCSNRWKFLQTNMQVPIIYKIFYVLKLKTCTSEVQIKKSSGFEPLQNQSTVRVRMLWDIYQIKYSRFT